LEIGPLPVYTEFSEFTKLINRLIIFNHDVLADLEGFITFIAEGLITFHSDPAGFSVYRKPGSTISFKFHAAAINPYAFTEHGALMAANLSLPRAQCR